MSSTPGGPPWSPSEEREPKIFGIGLNKTGTTTLGLCGQLLGYRTTSCDRSLLEDVVLRADLSRVFATVARYDLFEDWPYPLIFRELDERFPGSKFVLTTRRSAAVWLESLKRHALTTHPTRHYRTLVYGYRYPQRHEAAHLAFYEQHSAAVRAYFAGRDEDFIELCWEHGDDLATLATFLGKPVPAAPLPHANRSSERRRQTPRSWLLINRLLSRLPI